MASRSVCEEHQEEKRPRHGDDDDDRVDWISNLPDEILVKILSLLSFSETLETSVLSSRWIHLWKSAVTVLDFDAPQLLDSEEPVLLPVEPSPDLDDFIILDDDDDEAAISPPRERPVVERRRVYMNWVTRVLSHLNNVSKVNKLRLCFSLNAESNSQGEIDRWIEFAISKGVEHLDLSFGKTIDGVSAHRPDYCIKSPTGLSNIKYLRSLRLSRVDVKENTVEDFIINCPLLEELALDNASSLRKLRVAGSPALNYLEVTSCRRLTSMRIDHAPSLTTIVHRGLWKNVSFQNCPSLVHVDISCDDRRHVPDPVVNSLSAYGSQLKALSLEMDPWEMRFPDMYELSSLEQLRIQVVEAKSDDSLLRLVPLLNACPQLHRLRVELNVEYNPNGCEYEHRLLQPFGMGAVCRESIKVVEIVDFNGYDLDREFVLYVFEYFTGLERIVISTEVWRAEYYRRDSELMANYVVKLVEAHICALELESLAPPGVEFVLA
ncbi:F-box/FBD/LRR-repeat protein At1g13570 [Linum grandiflorum]